MNQRKIGVVLTYAGQLVGMVSGLLYTPIMLRLLGQSEYGLYQLVNSVVGYLGLISLGFGASYMRFYSRYKAQNDINEIARLNGFFMTVFSIMAFVALACGIFMIHNIEAIFDKGLTSIELDTARTLMWFMVFNLAATFPNSVFDCIITAHEQFTFQKMIILIQSLLNPFLTLPLLLIGYGSIGMVVISTVLMIFKSIANIYFCIYKISAKFKFDNLNFTLLREIGLFTIFIFLNQIIDQVNWNIGKFLAGKYHGTVAVAIFGIGAQINSIYLSLSTAVSGVFVPKVNAIVAETNDNCELSKLFTKIGRIQYIILMLILTAFWFLGKAFVRLWAGDNYTDSYYVTLLLITPVTVPLIQNLGIEIQRAKNKHHVRSIAYFVLAFFNILISIPLVKIYGAVGAACGTAFSLIVGNGVFMNWYYKKAIGLDIATFWISILQLSKGLILPIFVGVIIVCFISISSWIEFVLVSFFYIIIYCISVAKFGMNQEEKDAVCKPLMNFLRVKVYE